MADESLCYLTLHELAECIQTRRVSPVEVTQAHLARAERLNVTLNAFVTLVPDQALAAAQEAEREIMSGSYRGPLHGIPIGVKDIFDTAGIRTTHGSSFYRNHVPEQDAASVALLKQAGAIVLGKCNTHEFAAGSTTNNPWYGPTLNPWDTERAAGGSSGGSGAAVAAFLCPGATGTDTGGSIRNPAACNGVVGLKPTYGRVSLNGIFPNAISLDHPGPLTRTSRDAGLMLQGMAGYVRADPSSARIPVPDFTADIDAGIRGMRFAFCPDLHFCELDDAVAAGLESAARVLEDHGAHLETVPFELKDIVEETRQTIHWAEFTAVHRERFQREPEGYGEDIRKGFASRREIPVDAYVRASQNRLLLRRAFDEIFENIDALLLPSAPCVAPLIENGLSKVNGKVVNFGDVGIPLRQPLNVVGLPGLALPMGFADGLPISMQLIGPAWGEAKLIRIGHAYEQAAPQWRAQRPPHGG